jgi:hypothetical protein
LFFCGAAAPPHAQFEVKSPVVEKGVLELEALGSVQSRFNDNDDDEGAEEGGEEVEGGDEAGGGDEAEGGEEALEPAREGDDLGLEGGEDDDDDEKQRQGYEFSVAYGFSDFWKPEVALVLEQRKGRDLKADALEFENTFEVLPTTPISSTRKCWSLMRCRRATTSRRWSSARSWSCRLAG